MPWIQNISKKAIRSGEHLDPRDNTVLIQISDPPGDHPEPNFRFSEVYQFDFLDILEDGMSNNGTGEMEDMSEFAITEEQARKIVEILQATLKKGKNVIVHCHAGVARSGAVTEIGVMMGFEDTKVYRSPNAYVLKKMLNYVNSLEK